MPTHWFQENISICKITIILYTVCSALFLITNLRLFCCCMVLLINLTGNSYSFLCSCFWHIEPVASNKFFHCMIAIRILQQILSLWILRHAWVKHYFIRIE